MNEHVPPGTLSEPTSHPAQLDHPAGTPLSVAIPALPSLSTLALTFWKELLGGGVPSLDPDAVHGIGFW